MTPANPNPTNGGPENSLTLWGDKGDGQIVCDYGAAETFMHYLAGRFGVPFITALHRDPDQGLASVRKLAAPAGAEVMDAHPRLGGDDRPGRRPRSRLPRFAGGQAARYRTPTLSGERRLAEPAGVQEVGRAAQRLGLRSLPQAERPLLQAR